MLSIACCDVRVADANEVDATSMRGKVLCGYQGWFRCPGDGAGLGWIHWSWHNLQNLQPGTSVIPRQGGKFYWKQFHKAAELGLDMVYVAMFDEVDEGTAIYKVTNQPTEQAHFVTYEGFPSDWYLRLTAEGTKMLRDESEIAPMIPIGYSNPDGAVENLNTGTRYDYIQHAIIDANEGDVIVVEPGIYFENIFFEGKNLTVRSTEPDNPAVVTGGLQVYRLKSFQYIAVGRQAFPGAGQ